MMDNFETPYEEEDIAFIECEVSMLTLAERRNNLAKARFPEKRKRAANKANVFS